MRCKTCQRHLPVWLDGELSPRLANKVRAHLEGCASCAAQRDRLQNVLKVVDGLPAPEPSLAFRAGFEAKLRSARIASAEESQAAARAPGRAWWRLPALGGASAALLAAVLVGILLRPHHHRHQGANLVQAGELELARHFDLLKDYEVVSNLDALENFEVVAKLDTLLEERR